MTKLINIAIPKSGSGMLAQAVGGEHANIGPGAYNKPPRKIPLNKIKTFTEPFARSHMPYCVEYEEAMKKVDCLGVFLHRDLRDTIVSHAMYADKWKGHRSYFNFPTSEGVLLAKSGDRILEIIKKAHWLYDRYLGWMDVDFVLPLKYEELVNHDGSKNPDGFQKFIDYVGNYKGTLECGTPEQMIKRIDPEGCNTYRKGVPGDWKNHFKDYHIELFWENCGELMERFGYERLR